MMVLAGGVVDGGGVGVRGGVKLYELQRLDKVLEFNEYAVGP